MTGMINRDLERLVVDWLDETAGAGAPDYLDETLARIERVNQRPAWLSPGRWLPMRSLTLTLRRFEVPRFVPYLVALALLVLVAIAIAIAAGSQRRLPPPFGLAAPGVLVLDAGGDLVRIDPTGSSVNPFAQTPTREFGATWSRDGLLVAYWSTDVANPRGERTAATLWVADSDGSNARPILGDRRFETYELLPSVSWSPDSRQLAFSTTSGELYVADATGSNFHRIGDDSMGRCCPAWSPDGSLIAYNTGSNASVSFPGGQEDLYVARPDGSGETRVNRDPVWLPVADWSPDGSLAYVAGAGDIVVASRAGDGWTNRTVFAGGIENFFPRWSNASDRLAFVRDSALWVIGADGSNARGLGGGAQWVNIAAPCWSPDDRTLAALRVDDPDSFVEFEESASVVLFDVASGDEKGDFPVPRISAILACSWQRLAP